MQALLARIDVARFLRTKVLMLVILIFSPILETFLKDKSNHFEIHLELKDKTKLQELSLLSVN